MQPLDVPERAIQAFEKIHRLHVTVHDLRGSLTHAVRRDRTHHTHPLCLCVKAAGGEPRCATFEIIRLRPALHAFPEGRCHVCHAGLVEWIAPVYDGPELEWVLFAGARTPGAGLTPACAEPRTRWRRSPWQASAAMPPPVEDEEAGLILEHLLQLSARLRGWAHQTGPPRHAAAASGSLLTRRRALIRRYIENHHAGAIRLSELARQLGVGEDRATHLIRECCGQTFREMLIEARLTTAKELLRFSSLPVLEVALCSGFNEISHFDRLFRRSTGAAPSAYRKQFEERAFCGDKEKSAPT
ncbi:MAG: AraC family transcriptional regulator [Chthoniobacteraceae bacterium]|nr:AraC family transcriptional regulator [Chthoniobacteraceae bacterium]